MTGEDCGGLLEIFSLLFKFCSSIIEDSLETVDHNLLNIKFFKY